MTPSRTPRTDAEMLNPNNHTFTMVDANFARQLETELAQARDEARRNEEDAERYRWLREHGSKRCDNGQPYVAVHTQNDWGKWGEKIYETEQLDAAIDAARRGG